MSHPPVQAIPQGLRESLGQLKRWNDLLSMLDGLASGEAGISDARIQAEWDAFVDALATDCESAAGMLIEVFVCIARHRPELMDAILTDTLDPLFCIEVDEPGSILQWYEENRHLDAQSKAWIRDHLPECLDRFDFASLEFDDD